MEEDEENDMKKREREIFRERVGRGRRVTVGMKEKGKNRGKRKGALYFN